MSTARTTAASLGVAVTLAVLALVTASAEAISVGNKLRFERQVGAGVLSGNPNKVEACARVEPQVEPQCLPGQQSSLPGAFRFPWSAAASSNGNVYVADRNNDRVQELGKNGEFLLMFGWDVNKTKVKEGAPQEQRNVCTAAEASAGSECGAGEAGTGLAGQLAEAQDVVVDFGTRNVYVYENQYSRVEVFSENGQFLFMIGREVNPNGVGEGKNVCAKAEIGSCQAAKRSDPGSVEPGGFKAAQEYGNLLGICGNKLYVGDEGRVQEFNAASGGFTSELELRSTPFSSEGRVTALALDGSCNLYLTEAHGRSAANKTAPSGVFEFSPGGAHLATLDAGSNVIEAIALDPFGRMAAIEGPHESPHGALFQLPSGRLLSEFDPPPGVMGQETSDLSFNSEGELYIADPFHQDVEFYKPVSIVELTSLPCTNRAPFEVTLNGEANPKSVAGTEVWFGYGQSPGPLSKRTTGQSLPTATRSIPYRATVGGLVQNTHYDYRAEGRDVNGENAAEETLSCKTRAIAPAVGPVEAFPSTSTFASVLLSGTVDPENASTEYWFEYAQARPCGELEESLGRHVDLSECPGPVLESAVRESSENQVLTDQQAVTELQPSTVYRYRLVATDAFTYESVEEGGKTSSREARFTTGEAPAPLAVTLPAGSVGPTSAVLSGIVNAGGAPARYAFEVGIDDGPNTEYDTVFSNSAGSAGTPVGETYTLTGLRPGAAYAYRITARNGYGVSLGTSQLFATPGISEALQVPTPLAELPTPPILFPPNPSGRKAGGKPSAAQQLARALRACRRKTRRQQAVCERKAHRKYRNAHGAQRRASRHRENRNGRVTRRRPG